MFLLYNNPVYMASYVAISIQVKQAIKTIFITSHNLNISYTISSPIYYDYDSSYNNKNWLAICSDFELKK